MTFSRSKNAMLIDMVRVNPVLYDPHNDHFKNIVMKHQIWQNISANLNLPLPDVKKRWRHFRDHYFKKLKRYEAGRTEGKPWEYMNKLEFLALSRARRSDAAESEPEELDHQVTFVMPPGYEESRHGRSTAGEQLSAENHLEPSMKRTKYSEPSPISVGEELKPPEHSFREEEKSVNYKFFESMADIVCGLPPRLAAEARLKVCQLITEVELQMHSEQPTDRWQTSHPVKREE